MLLVLDFERSHGANHVVSRCESKAERNVVERYWPVLNSTKLSLPIEILHYTNEGGRDETTRVVRIWTRVGRLAQVIANANSLSISHMKTVVKTEGLAFRKLTCKMEATVAEVGVRN